ncbi:MAG TPA: metalloregulator ArsR/SmtB family transcription factor [Gaiellaceae bacterium]|jgi:DNA-binding transcriptional ArsR family regulator
MTADVDLASAGALLGDRTRAGIMLALAAGPPLAASELATRCRISPSLASAHLARLLDGGLVEVEQRGRQRHYRLAGPEVAHAIEALSAIARPAPARSLREATNGEALRRARTCYDHLAGVLGVTVTEALERDRVVVRDGDGYEVTSKGARRLGELGIEVSALAEGRRPLTRSCLDWSERRPHLAGALGAAIAARCFELGWIERSSSSRAVTVTPAGAAGFRAELGVEL